MGIKRTLCLVTALLLMCCPGVRAESELPKRGTYGARCFWQASGKWFGVEKEHLFWVREFNETVFNDAGTGFSHRASGVCPGVRDVVKGFVNAHGYCVMTDEDGDNATLVWKCRGRGRCEGDAEFLGGTGKYTGLKGSHTVHGVVRSAADPEGSSGYAVWKGTWRLPE